MIRFIRGVTLIILLASLVTSSHVVAQEVLLQPTGETPVERISANCSSISATLSQLHTNDALARVNSGQVYNSVSAQLMAKLNSRLALNRMTSTKLIEITERFEQERATFAKSYSEYESQLSSLLKSNCQDNPANYYALLLTTRDARVTLKTSVEALNTSIGEYQVAVEELRQNLSAPSDGANNGD